MTIGAIGLRLRGGLVARKRINKLTIHERNIIKVVFTGLGSARDLGFQAISTCFPFWEYLALGPVGGEALAVDATCPLAKPSARGPLGAWIVRTLSRLRGPVGGAAPNFEEDAAGPDGGPGVAEEAVADAANEFSNARGARGGAFPDIACGGEQRGYVLRWWWW